VDVIVTPTLAQVPALVGALRDDDDPAGDFEAQKAFTPYTSPYNMTGQPAITLPVHWTDDDLPVGVQLIGRPLQEAQLLSVAAQVEAALPWIQRHPEIW
jgi:amidase